MMAAYMWSMTYSLILMFEPAAFRGVDVGISVTDSFSQMSYFSFVTITTQGYGDISLIEIKEWAGHSSITTTQRYQHLVPGFRQYKSGLLHL